MERSTRIIKNILWGAALTILVLGIFFFALPFDFKVFGTEINLSGAHVGAITSGILSMVSFGYHFMRKNPLPTGLSILHVAATIGLLALVIYYRFYTPENFSQITLPNLDSSPEVVSQWQRAHSSGPRMMKSYYIWLVMQILFFALVAFKVSANKKG